MVNIDTMVELFFRDLKKYNSTNYRNLINADLVEDRYNPEINKCFSSIVTRYWIFKEKHLGEFSESDFNVLYFKLNIDLISKYFSEYPDSDMSVLQVFQDKARSHENGD